MRRYKKKRMNLLLLGLLLLLLMSGCEGQALTSSEEIQSQTAAPGTAVVYYMAKNDSRMLSRSVPLEKEGEQALMEIFSILAGGSFEDGHSAIPSGLSLDHIGWQEQSIVLYLTGKYPACGTAEETLCRAALARTMLAAAGVESMIICVNDEELKDQDGNDIGPIKLDSFLLDAGDNSELQTIEVKLFFANKEGSMLACETASAQVPMGKTKAEAVVELLIGGPKYEGHQATIPAATGILGVSVKNRTCYVNVSDEFINQALPIPEKISVYSLVNSLTALSGIDQVQLTVEGSADIKLSDGISLAAPLAADQALVDETAEIPEMDTVEAAAEENTAGAQGSAGESALDPKLEAAGGSQAEETTAETTVETTAETKMQDLAEQTEKDTGKPASKKAKAKK